MQQKGLKNQMSNDFKKMDWKRINLNRRSKNERKNRSSADGSFEKNFVKENKKSSVKKN